MDHLIRPGPTGRAALLVAAALGAGATPAPASADTLAALQWSRRVVIAFAVPDSARAEALRAAVERGACRIADRDLAVYLVRAGEPEPVGAAPALPGERAADLRAAFRPRDPRFEMILIGKDGGVKARSTDPADLDGFFDLIDTMPMRRQEIASRPAACEPG